MMDFEYWWLIALPLFFTFGWIAARIDIKQLLSETTSLPAAYFKGLNFLITDQHDKAIEAFTEAVQANAESLELHFALGSLFRRSGEVDRAINLHLSLLDRKELPAPQREAIKAELAQDYLKAGLYDRAEELFSTLDSGRYQQPALRALLEIYIREREWHRAVKTATELERVSGIPFRKEIAQFYCEMAVKSILDQDLHTARHELEMALDANKNCVRANMMLGELEAHAKAHKVAIGFWKRIEFQKPEFLGIVANKLLQSYRELGELDQGIELLRQYYQQYKLPSLLAVVFDITLAEQGADAAVKMALDELERQPSLQTLDKLLKARSFQKTASTDIGVMQQTIRYAIGNRSIYCCEQCGFKARNFHWQCPACNAWESLPAEPKEIPA
ncbi:MAG: lipopolysaccharide assembly protein LapB [Methylophilaceae bacterium]|nr:lipopolysaccharide assembly protein LapB [Methylophilaceae bacterium]